MHTRVTAENCQGSYYETQCTCEVTVAAKKAQLDPFKRLATNSATTPRSIFSKKTYYAQNITGNVHRDLIASC